MTDHNIIHEVGKLLIENDLTIGFAESFTGGMLMSTMTSIPGISKSFEGGIVCYHENIKRRVLKVPPALLEEHSCESQQASTAIAKGVASLIPTHISVGITGLASPGASESSSKPVGTIFITIIIGGSINEKELRLYGDRNEIREKACFATFEYIHKLVSRKTRINSIRA